MGMNSSATQGQKVSPAFNLGPRPSTRPKNRQPVNAVNDSLF
jgi:hypothetical protein